jgi:hypothetical protein
MSTFMQRTYLSHQESFFIFALISTRLEGTNALLAFFDARPLPWCNFNELFLLILFFLFITRGKYFFHNTRRGFPLRFDILVGRGENRMDYFRPTDRRLTEGKNRFGRIVAGYGDGYG